MKNVIELCCLIRVEVDTCHGSGSEVTSHAQRLASLLAGDLLAVSRGRSDRFFLHQLVGSKKAF